MSIYNQGFGGGMNPSITVTTTAGATVTVTLGTKSVTAIATGGTAKISVWDYGSYSIHAALGDAVGDATVNVIAVQDYAVTVETAVPIPTVLNNATWAQIKEVAEKSQGSNYWAVGDTKQITINGKLSDGLTLNNYSTWVYIIGFDHNSEKEGTGIAFQGFKTAQSGGKDVCLCDSGYSNSKTSGQWFNMNNSNTNSGGWKNSRMRSTTLPLVKSALPPELTSVIKTTSIYSDNTGGGSDVASYVTATQDDIYLLADFEIIGSRNYANSAERNYQQQYEYYIAGNSKVKYRYDNTATAAIWWERSPSSTTALSFCFVNSVGSGQIDSASDSLGLAPAFKVGGGVIAASELEVGHTVKLTESGVVSEYLVVQQGSPSDLYDSSCNGTWLLRKDCPVLRPFNSNAVGNYVDGNVRQYLENDFYNSLGNESKAAILNVKIPYVAANGTFYSGVNGLSSNVFILSISETNIYPLSKVDGATLSYFSGIGNVPSDKRVSNWNNQPVQWWTRTRDYDNTTSAYLIEPTGVIGSNSADGWKAVRPCVIINSNTLFDSNTLTLT